MGGGRRTDEPSELQREQRQYQEELQRPRANKGEVRSVKVRRDLWWGGRDGSRRKGRKTRAHLQNVLPQNELLVLDEVSRKDPSGIPQMLTFDINRANFEEVSPVRRK